MNKLFEQLGYQKNLTFKDVFNTELSQKIITSYWEKLIKQRSFGLFALPFSTKDALRALFASDEEMKPKQAMYFIGLITLAKDEGGIRALRSVLAKKLHPRTWYRFMKDLQTASDIITKNKVRDWVTQIDRKLAKFEPYKHKKVGAGLSTEAGLPCKPL